MKIILTVILLKREKICLVYEMKYYVMSHKNIDKNYCRHRLRIVRFRAIQNNSEQYDSKTYNKNFIFAFKFFNDVMCKKMHFLINV